MFKRVPPLSRSWNGRFPSKEVWLVGTENIHHDHLCKSQIQSIPVIPVGHNWITACENWTCGRILTVLSSWPEKVRTQMIMKDEVHLFVPGMRYLLVKLKFCCSWNLQRMLFVFPSKNKNCMLSARTLLRRRMRGFVRDNKILIAC